VTNREDRQYPETDAAGRVTFNHFQQSEPEEVVDDGRPEVETTDPWGITGPRPSSGEGS
jgi:hypothetical protein